MKFQRKKWIAVGTMAALGIGTGAAVAAPMLNGADMPAGVTTTSDAAQPADSANSPASPASAASATSASSAD